MIFDQTRLRKALSWAKDLKDAAVHYKAKTQSLKISAEHIQLEIKDAGAIAAENDFAISDSMAKMIEVMEPGEITIEKDDKGTVIRKGKTRAKFLTPTIVQRNLPGIKEGATATVPGDVLYNLIDRVRYAVAIMDSRPALTGLRFCSTPQNAYMAEGLDGFQIARTETKESMHQGENMDMILAMPAALKLLKLLDGENVTIRADKAQAEFSTENWTLLAALIAAPPANTDQIISATMSGEVVKFHSADLLGALERAKIALNGDNQPVRIDISSEAMRFSANGQAFEFEDEALEFGGNVPADFGMRMAFKIDYLRNMIVNAKCSTATLRISGEVRPVVITAEDSAMGILFTGVTLPVRAQG